MGYIRNLTKGMSHAEAERHREDQVVVAECREALVKAHKEMEMQQAELLDVQRQVKAHAERSAQAAVAAEGLQALRDTALRSSEMAKAAAQSQGERLRGELDETREILRESMDREKSLKERLRAATREAGEVRSLAMRASRDTNHARRETTAARQKLRRLGKTMASDEAMAAVSAARARVKQGEVLAKQLKQQSEESRREVEEIRKEAAQTSRCLAEAKFEAAAKEAEANLRLSEQVTLARATEQRLREELANAALALDAERCFGGPSLCGARLASPPLASPILTRHLPATIPSQVPALHGDPTATVGNRVEAGAEEEAARAAAAGDGQDAAAQPERGRGQGLLGLRTGRRQAGTPLRGQSLTSEIDAGERREGRPERPARRDAGEEPVGGSLVHPVGPLSS